MATEGTKFQINYKLNDGTLINLYAANVQELETGLADLAMNAMNIRATGLELTGGVAPVAAPAPTVASVAQAFNATPVAAPAPAPVEAAPVEAAPVKGFGAAKPATPAPTPVEKPVVQAAVVPADSGASSVASLADEIANLIGEVSADDA